MSEQAGRTASGLEGVAINRDAEIPIGVQLAWSLRTRICDGTFEPGRQLPGLRELAEMTGVNVNTARAVYQRLEHAGLIESRQGSGTFVASAPRRASAVSTIAADAARAAQQTGVEPRDVAAALYVMPGQARPSGSTEAKRRRVLREQIATLERTLVELEANHPAVAPPPEETAGEAGPVLLGVAELERVQAVLLRRLTTLHAAIDRLGRQELASEDMSQAEREEVASESMPEAARQGRGARGRPRTRPAPAGA